MKTQFQIMGNQLSHYNIFKEMVLRNYRNIIVCQDDIVFKTGFYEQINEVIENLDKTSDAEIIYFAFHKYGVRDVFLPFDLTQSNNITIGPNGPNGPNEPNGPNIMEGSSSISVGKLNPYSKALYDCNNSLGYILTLKGAINYINYIEKHGFSCAADHNMNEYLIERGIYYGTTDVLATTNATFGSDIFENFYNENTNPHKLTNNNNFLDYLDLYNWTNDLPDNTNAKLGFVEVLSPLIRLNSCSILEVGTYSGTSIIGMLQYLPNASATVIDTWKDYIEKSDDKPLHCFSNMIANNCETVFKNNIEIAGMEKRIISLKGESHIQLLELIAKKRTFDFIYIDGSHKCLDCYTDCLLGWEVLKVGGIMGIDDYLYFISKSNVLDNCFDGVNHFLEKIKGEFTVILSGYRLFIQKTM